MESGVCGFFDVFCSYGAEWSAGALQHDCTRPPDLDKKKSFLWKEPTDTKATFDLREVAFPPIRLVASTFPGIDPATGKRLSGIGCRTARCFWYLYLP